MRRMLWTIALGAALLLSACQGRSQPQQSVTLAITATEFAFTPAAFSLPAGATAEVQFTNAGQLEHDLAIMAAGYTAQPPFDAADEANVLFRTAASPGETVTGSFAVPTEPGTYQVVSAPPAPGRCRRQCHDTPRKNNVESIH